MTISNRIKIDEILPQGELLSTLCLMKARPRVVADLLPTIPEYFIYNVYRMVNNTKAPKGLLPSEIRECVRTPRRRLQTTAVLRIYESAEEYFPNRAERYIHAYRRYLDMFASDLQFDFNRIWFIIRQFQIGRIALHQCSRCKCYTAHNRDDVRDRQFCCGCQFVHGKPTKTNAAQVSAH